MNDRGAAELLFAYGDAQAAKKTQGLVGNRRKFKGNGKHAHQ
jgi:hypothetical protein